MSEVVKIYKKDNVHAIISANKGILREIYEEFSFRIANHRFNPKVKAGVWDGYIRLLSYKTGEIYLGLIPKITSFLKKRGYEIELDPNIFPTNDVTLDTIREFIDEIGVEDLDEREYQIDTITHSLKWNRSLVLSPTNSGKSFVQFVIASYYIKKKKERVLLVVPYAHLVTQMRDDFNTYKNEYLTIQTIEEGRKIHPDTEVFITTWQSIDEQPEEWFEQFKTVFVDEVHLSTAKGLTSIMEKCKLSYARHGFTGTIKDSKAHELVLIGLYGPKYIATTNKEMITKGYSTPLVIRPIMFVYSKEIVKSLTKKDKDGKKIPMKYIEEEQFLSTFDKRNNMICEKINEWQGNTIVMFVKTEKHGVIVHDMMKEKYASRSIHYVSGSVSVKKRNEIKTLLEKSDNAICFASTVFSTGVNIKRLHNLALISLGKAKIRILQSLGRMLRTHEEKTEAVIYDFFDDLRGGSKKMNYSMKHFMERLDYYNREGFTVKPVTIVEIR